MRRILFALTLSAAVLPVFACSAGADRAPAGADRAPSGADRAPAAAGTGTIEVVATHGPEKFAAAGLAVGVTTCTAGSVSATLTTGRDGKAHQDFAPDCYQVQVSSVPMGCRLATDAARKVDVVAGRSVAAEFGLACA
ncbi:hypothetical protein [Nocardia veterana]|uniref:Uncharacterized protein n=1 Tax=Nocardia veterana TaxID=132249 RepID=A0A7X6M2U6_9NOCA|nr:hypothetical protein [Nocardia veterana]NKY89147.1 hypothetical protein [Nocardia veterana]